MGISHSTSSNISKIDCMASSYILNMSIKDLTLLQDKEYCNKLILLVSNIIKQNLSIDEINTLFKKIDPTDYNKFHHSIEIAKFYIKIGHLFAINISTIINIKNILEQSQSQANDIKGGGDEDDFVVNIQELMDLYYDSDYNVNNGMFLGMNTETKNKYNDDLQQFYSHFTQDKDIMPITILKFTDIPFKLHNNYIHNNETNNNETNNNKTNKNININNIINYANNLKKILFYLNNTIENLIQNTSQLFIIKDKEICLNNDLNTDIIQELIIESRNIITEFYFNYEEEVLENAKIYEAIVMEKVIESTKNQIISIDNELLKFME